jgi:hypothetical protein
MIGFGDFPESVDLDLARQRVERQRSELSERSYKELSSRSREISKPGDISGASNEQGSTQERPRFVRVDPSSHSDSLSQARTVSDCEIFERNQPNEAGRKRGLSSPETVVGLGFING